MGFEEHPAENNRRLKTQRGDEGDWLVQTAAASSVGKFVLQLARQYRFKTINVIRRREQETMFRV